MLSALAPRITEGNAEVRLSVTKIEGMTLCYIRGLSCHVCNKPDVWGR